MSKNGLGKGLGAIFDTETEEQAGVKELKINEIEPNVHQPRKNFDDIKLEQLAQSIKDHGIVQPIIVRKEKDTYRIVAGERRWRAARIAGFENVPVIIKEISNRQVMEIALIENIQREDLNPIEEAEAFDRLIKEYEMTQEDLSRVIGKSRPAIANAIRLLNLCEKVKEYVITDELSSGHARALVAIEDQAVQQRLAKEIIERNLTVRETEALVKRFLENKPTKKITKKNEVYFEIEEKLKSIFGTKVQLISNNKKGKIMIEYYSNDELDRILELVNSIEQKNPTS